MSGCESIQRIARSSPYLRASSENGATLTEHSPPRVVIRAGSCWPITASARASCSRITVLASMPSRCLRPASDIVAGAVAVGPSWGGRTASRTAEPTAYPRRATLNGNSDAYALTLDVPPPCHWGQTRRRCTPSWTEPSVRDESGSVISGSFLLVIRSVWLPVAHAHPLG